MDTINIALDDKDIYSMRILVPGISCGDRFIILLVYGLPRLFFVNETILLREMDTKRIRRRKAKAIFRISEMLLETTMAMLTTVVFPPNPATRSRMPGIKT
jgi:hypothetical protein